MAYYRVHRAGEMLYSDHQSWLWGMTPDESAETGELLDGVSCCDSVYHLVQYFAHTVNGAVEDELSIAEVVGDFDVIKFDGDGYEDENGEEGEYIINPAVELGRYTWEQVIAAYDADTELESQYTRVCETGFELPE